MARLGIVLISLAIPCGLNAQISVRDSAGIRIIDFDPMAIEDSVALAPEPTWSFDFVPVASGDHYLSSGISVFPLADGLVGIADPRTQTVFTGRPDSGWSALAGRGDGPAEVRRLTAARPDADGGVWVMDGIRERLVSLSPDGAVRTDVAVPDRDLTTTNWWPRLGSHWFLGGAMGPAGGGDLGTTHLSSRPLIRLSDTDLDSLASYPVREWYFSEASLGPTLLSPRAYGVGTLAGYWVGYGGEAELDLWSEHLDAVVRWPRVERELRPLADSILAAFLEVAPDFQTSPRMLAIWDEWPIASDTPQFSGLAPAADGGVAIGPFWPRWGEHLLSGRRPAGDWWLLDAEGLPTRVVSLPPGFVPHHFGPDHVLGVFTDELEREFAQRWELVVRN